MPPSRNPEATSGPSPTDEPTTGAALPEDLSPPPSLLFSHQPPSPSPDPSSYDSPSDPSPESGDAFGSARPSTDADAPRLHTPKQRARALQPTTRAAVETAGGIAHTLLTVEGSPERDHGLFLPDEDDVEAISVPLAGLASRRAPDTVANPDVTDLIALAMGVVGYVVKQVQKRAYLRSLFAPASGPETAQGDADAVTDQ